MSDSTTKTCTKCGTEYPSTNKYFVRDKNRKDGLFPHCKFCVNTWKKIYRKNNAEKISEGKKDWYRRNTSHVIKKTSRWKENNKDKDHFHGKKYRSYHQEQRLAGRHRYRARKMDNGGNYRPEDIDRIMSEQNRRCYYCEIQLIDKFHRDHVIPLFKGGNNNPDNIVITCPKCNLSKGRKTLEEWVSKIKDSKLKFKVQLRIIERNQRL